MLTSNLIHHFVLSPFWNKEILGRDSDPAVLLLPPKDQLPPDIFIIDVCKPICEVGEGEGASGSSSTGSELPAAARWRSWVQCPKNEKVVQM